MDPFIIFGAKYLVMASAAVALFALWYAPAERRLRAALAMLATLALTYLIGKLGSLLFYDPRPFVVQHAVPLLPHAADNGFPSDHTLLAAGLAAAVTLFDRKAGALLWVLALVVGSARVAALVHHPIDIAGSLAAAAIAAVLVALAARLFFKSRE